MLVNTSLFAAIIAGLTTVYAASLQRHDCQTVEPGNVLAGTSKELLCSYSDPTVIECYPSKSTAYEMKFALASPDSPDKLFGRIKRVTFINTPNAPGTKPTERKVYGFTSGNMTYYYRLEGYGYCYVNYSELNPFGDFNAGTLHATVSDNFNG